ncbi:MAG: UbiA family prenyltransferase, partial [Verrucomicrobia bacterium]|nr:UbiA family prenyltransferase [Verrucomicrobiota bacterium]
MASAASPSLRTLLILGRVSNLPTVWSNCLAGWWLGGGGGSPWALVRLCLGASLMYVAGMYLNDAFDAEFDRQYRRTRPIPSGAIAESLVWRLGWILLGAGWVLV